MSDDLIAALVWIALMVTWYFIGRNDGRNAERKKLDSFIRFSAPVFRALIIDRAERVEVTVEKTSDGEYTASQVATVVKDVD